MHSQTCLLIAWYLSWLQWEYCAGRWRCFMQHSCIVTECLYSFLLCHCVWLGFKRQFLWSLDCMWGTHVGCQGPLVHALFSSIGRIVCYGRGDKHHIYDVRISRTSRSQIHMSFLISAFRFGSVEWGTGRWCLEGRRIICQVSNALTDWCLISHAVCIHPPLPLSLFQSLPCHLIRNEPHRWLIWNTSHNLKLCVPYK